MEKRQLNIEELSIAFDAPVKVTTMKDIVEVQYMEKVNTEAHLRKLDSDRYVDLRTGEVKEYEHTINRSEGVNSLRKTFNRLRELINANFEGAPNELFITLTYKGSLQTRDTKRVYKDFNKFMKRFKYRYKDLTTIDYINVLEPHESGNFHMHALLRFNDLEKIYIPNEDLRSIWGNGFVTVQSLKGVDNIGAYVSAYLSDIEVPEGREYTGNSECVEKDVHGQKKKFVKGARLIFYPVGVKIYRKSKGIKNAEQEKMSYKKALKKVTKK